MNFKIQLVLLTLVAFSSALAKDNIEYYQRGAEWSAHQPTPSELANPVISKAYQATMMIGGGTAFYIGEFEGQHIIATNFHVVVSFLNSPTISDNLPLLWNSTGIQAKITKVIGAWSEIDLAFLQIETAPGANLKKLGHNFDFVTIPAQGTRLGVMGFGSAGRTTGTKISDSYPYLSSDSDCVVLSKTNEYRFMLDPDILNPDEYMRWSFAHTCDTSPGNSGSMMFDILTGQIYGILWGGTMLYGAYNFINADGTTTLREVDNRGVEVNDDTVWKNFIYGVPAVKIKEILLQKISAQEITGEDAKIISAILN